jgi:hypothetical protein
MDVAFAARKIAPSKDIAFFEIENVHGFPLSRERRSEKTGVMK